MPFGPTTSSTSSSISSPSPPRPTPTESASSPSFAASTSSPSASCTRSGNPLAAATACADDTVSMAVPPVSTTISHSPRSLHDRTRREDRHLKFYGLRDNLLAELAQDVVGTAQQLARERELGAALTQPRLQCQVVGVVG